MGGDCDQSCELQRDRRTERRARAGDTAAPRWGRRKCARSRSGQLKLDKLLALVLFPPHPCRQRCQLSLPPADPCSAFHASSLGLRTHHTSEHSQPCRNSQSGHNPHSTSTNHCNLHSSTSIPSPDYPSGPSQQRPHLNPPQPPPRPTRHPTPKDPSPTRPWRPN